MKMQLIPFGTTDWSTIEKPSMQALRGCPLAHAAVQRHPGAHGRVFPGYLADHWCSKGHILLVLDGELRNRAGRRPKIHAEGRMSYQVADGAEPHRSSTRTGARLFIVDEGVTTRFGFSRACIPCPIRNGLTLTGRLLSILLFLNLRNRLSTESSSSPSISLFNKASTIAQLRKYQPLPKPVEKVRSQTKKPNSINCFGATPRAMPCITEGSQTDEVVGLDIFNITEGLKRSTASSVSAGRSISTNSKRFS